MAKLNLDQTNHNRPTELRLKIRVPKRYQQEPVISELGTRHNLKVNILAAVLGANGEGDGWFDLSISGRAEDIDNALVYLSDLDVEVWNKSDSVPTGW